MASAAEIARFKLLIGGTDLTDLQLGTLIDDNTSLNMSAYEYWLGMAGQYAHLVSITENASKRDMSDLWTHAKGQAALFREAAASEDGDGLGGSTTRAIVRT